MRGPFAPAPANAKANYCRTQTATRSRQCDELESEQICRLRFGCSVRGEEWDGSRCFNEKSHLHVCGVEDLARAAAEISAVVGDELGGRYNKITNKKGKRMMNA